MELLHIHYHAKGKTLRYLLLLYLGQRSDKICGIVTESIGDPEKQKIVENKERLSHLSFDRQLEWIRANCPTAYRNGYREIFNSNITIVERHSI